MFAAVNGGFTSRLWLRGLAHIRGSRFSSTSAEKASKPAKKDAALAADIAGVAACKTPLKVSRFRRLQKF